VSRPHPRHGYGLVELGDYKGWTGGVADVDDAMTLHSR
jgi:hypothetical protein